MTMVNANHEGKLFAWQLERREQPYNARFEIETAAEKFGEMYGNNSTVGEVHLAAAFRHAALDEMGLHRGRLRYAKF